VASRQCTQCSGFWSILELGFSIWEPVIYFASYGVLSPWHAYSSLMQEEEQGWVTRSLCEELDLQRGCILSLKSHSWEGAELGHIAQAHCSLIIALTIVVTCLRMNRLTLPSVNFNRFCKHKPLFWMFLSCNSARRKGLNLLYKLISLWVFGILRTLTT
jgi:hypothetical protein